MVNENQVKGGLKDIAGKIQEEAGKLVGNKAQETKGLKQQIEGKAERALGDIKEVVNKARDALGDAIKKH